MSAGDSAQQIVSIPCTTEQNPKLSQTFTFPLSCQLTNPNFKTKNVHSKDNFKETTQIIKHCWHVQIVYIYKE